jgi:hypothetical protein
MAIFWNILYKNVQIPDTIGEHKDDEVDMSLISGKIRATAIENGETSDKNKQVIEYTAG